MTITNNCTHIWRCALLPDNRGYKGIPAKQFIAEDFHICLFIIVNANPKTAFISQKPPQNLQAGPNQLEPLAVLQIVVVVLKRRAGVVGRVDVDALHLPGILALQCLQRQEVVPVDEHIFRVRVGGGVGQCGVFNQQAGLHQNRLVLAVPGQFQLIGHGCVPPVRSVPRMQFSGCHPLLKRPCSL